LGFFNFIEFYIQLGKKRTSYLR